MSVGGEFGRRVSDDELCAEVRQAVEGGDEDALRRLGFGGFGGYVQRLSEIMSDSVTGGLDLSADDFGAIMGEVASPARYAHHLVNEAGTAIQSAKDKPLGIRIKPAEPDFDDDALCGTVGKAASMDTPEQTAATLADGLGYAVKKAGNDFIKANAEQRSKAGFEVGVKRSGDSKCCEWCAARIGSWAIANAPDDVFGCHANCSCTVEYTSSTGAKTSARGANLHRYGAGAFVEVEYQPPHVLSREEAREKGGFDEPKRLTKNPVESQPHRLTGGVNGGIIGLASNAHSRNRELEETIKRCINQEKPVFADDLAKYFNNIPPEKGKYIMALHGSAESGYIYGYKIDARTLANIVKSRKDYNGKDEIVLISCNTGSEDVKKCFAQELADAMGVRIHAPTHYGAISPWGSYYSSDKRGKRSGKFKHFDPKERDDDT